MKRSLLLTGFSLFLFACSKEMPIPAPEAELKDFMNIPRVESRRPAMAWVPTQTGTGSEGEPQMELVLTVTSTNTQLFTTTCIGTVNTEVPLVDGSIATALCKWRTTGERFGVFLGEDGKEATIRRRPLDEATGYGPWEDLYTF